MRHLSALVSDVKHVLDEQFRDFVDSLNSNLEYFHHVGSETTPLSSLCCFYETLPNVYSASPGISVCVCVCLRNTGRLI